MPVIRILVSFLVLAVGLLFAVLLLAAGFLELCSSAAVSAGRRRRPQFRAATSRTPPRSPVRPRDDVIDVEATPVKE